MKEIKINHGRHIKFACYFVEKLKLWTKCKKKDRSFAILMVRSESKNDPNDRYFDIVELLFCVKTCLT